MVVRNCVIYSTLFLAIWAGIAWHLLAQLGWSSSELQTVAGLGLGYVFGGLTTLAVFSTRSDRRATPNCRSIQEHKQKIVRTRLRLSPG